MANPTPNEAKQSAGWQYLWGLLGQPKDEVPYAKDYNFGKEDSEGMGFLGSLGTYKTKGEKKDEKSKMPEKKKKEEKQAKGSKYNASQLQLFAENKVIPDEDYTVKRQEYIAGQRKLDGKKSKEELGKEFDNMYKRASEFYSGLQTDQSGLVTMANLQQMAQLAGIKLDKLLTDQENLYRVNAAISKMKASGMDPFKERDSWDDPRAVKKFLETAANSMGSFTTPEQLVFSGKGSNKTYSRATQAQLLPTSGIASSK